MKQEINQFEIYPAREFKTSRSSQPYCQNHRNNLREIAAHLLRFLVVVALLLAVLSAGATNGYTGKPRRTVGVVLSGGGAKGIAHVGVLKALEEYEIPIDFIAGTSMGAIVGGLYAAGFSPQQIEGIIMSEEFEEASRGVIDNQYNYYYLQQDPDPTWFNLTFDWDSRLEFQNILKENIPANIVSPFVMDFMFMELLGPAAAASGNDFDRLFVPFRCIASDIMNKKQVVMRKGNLPDAVRASMTFPLYFKPITIDGVMLLDGGMFNNFPADVMLEDFNPDVIIGSIVASNPNPPNPNNLVSQLENMLMHTTQYEVYSRYGIIIEPDVPQLSVTDFSQNQRVISAGYEATMKKMGEIVSRIDFRHSEENLSRRRDAFNASKPVSVVKDIYISGLNEDHKEFVLNFLNPSQEHLSLEDIKINYLRMLNFTHFQHIYPRMRYNEQSGSYTLCLEMEKNHEILYGIGGNLSSRSVNQIFAKFNYQKLSSRPFSFSNNLYLGNVYKSSSFAGRWDFTGKRPGYMMASFTYSHLKYNTQSVYFFEEAPSSNITQQEGSLDLRAGIPVGNRARMEFGGMWVAKEDNYYNTHLFARRDTADITRFKPFVAYITFESNTLNRKQLASRGRFLNATVRYVHGNEQNIPGSTTPRTQTTYKSHSWWELQIKYERLLFSGSRFNPGFISELFMSNRPLFSNYASSLIMARQFNPFPLTQTRYLPQYRANQYVATGLKTLYSFGRLMHLQSEVYVFHPIKKIETPGNTLVKYKSLPGEVSMLANLAFIYHTPPGPLSLSLSYFQNESHPWVFMINFGYILFNRQTFI